MKSQYKIDSISFKKLQNEVELPPFQRNVVWTEEKRKNFVYTVLTGSPFGALLLYKETDHFLLVDGLQRYTTLRDFIISPRKYINLADDCKNFIDDIINIIRTETNTVVNFTSIRKKLLNKLEEIYMLDKDISILGDLLIDELPFLQACDINVLFKIQRKFHSMFLSLSEKYNIFDLEIPVIIYAGDFEKLPDIFEKMNSNGTQLNKYEIYAAKWSYTTFQLEDAILLEIIDKKYEGMIENTGIEILDYESGQILKNQSINLFEYCFSLGKLLKQECPYILGTKFGNSSDVDSLGFVLLSAILSNSAKKIGSLPKYFESVSSSDLIKLKNKILECAKEIAKLLDGYILSIDEKYVSKYIESQMICIISTLFQIKFTKSDEFIGFTNNTSSDAKHQLQMFKKIMPKRYIYDIITNYWIGNGDRKITDELGKTSLFDNRYLVPILKDSWYLVLNDWTTEQLTKPLKNISGVVKLFINYIYHLSISQAKYKDKKFNFEYIVSKDRLSKSIKNCNAISALGNICLLPQFETRSKQEKTIYEQIDNRSIIYDTKNFMLEDFLYPERSELSFVKTNDTLTSDNYYQFIKNRHTYLINKFVDLIGE